MIRKTFVIRLKDGADPAEYKRRHDNLWPGVDKIIRYEGIHNYTIWRYENLLFAYYEVDEEEPPLTPELIAVDDKWQEYMSELIDIVKDPETGERFQPDLMFLHE